MLLRILRILFPSPKPKHRSRTRPRNPSTPSPQKTVTPKFRYNDDWIKRKSALTGKCYVIDGDTIVIQGHHIRLAGIDAPEMNHPYGKVAKSAMIRLCKGHVVRAVLAPSTTYDRLVATCYLPDGRDLSAELVKQGLALDWAKFSGGKYRKFETSDARKKHWRAAAKQRGQYDEARHG